RPKLLEGGTGKLLFADQELFRIRATERVPQLGETLRLQREKFSGRRIEQSRPDSPVAEVHRSEKVVLGRLQRLFIQHRSRGDDAGDLAPEDSRPGAGRLDLLADGHFQAALD